MISIKELTSERVIKFLLLVVIALLPILFASWTSEPLELNKQTFLVFVISAIGLVWVGSMIKNGKLDFVRGLFGILLFAWVFLTLLSSFIAGDKYGALVGNGAQISNSFLTVLFLAIFVFFVVSVFSSFRERVLAITVFVISSFIAVVLGLLKAYGLNLFAGINIINTVSTSVSLAILGGAAIIIGLALFFAESWSARWFKIVLAVGSLASLWYLIVIDSLFVWVAMIVGLLVMVLVQFKLKQVDFRKLVALVGLTVLSFVFVFINVPTGADLPLEINLKLDTSFALTKDIVTNEFNGILGTGPGSFGYNYARLKPAEINQSPFWAFRFNKTGSEILTVLANTGVFGLAALISVLALGIYVASRRIFWKKEEDIQMEESHEVDSVKKETKSQVLFFEGGILSAFIFLIVSAFTYPFGLVLWFAISFLFGIIISGQELGKRSIVFNESTTRAVAWSAFMILILFLFLAGIFIVSGRYLAEVYYTRGLTGQDVVQVEKDLARAISFNSFSDIYRSDFAAFKFGQLINSLQQSNANLEQIQIEIQEVLNLARRPIAMNPLDANNWAFLGSIYQNLVGLVGGSEQFVELNYQAALDREPNNPQFWTELGRNYLAQYDILVSGGALSEQISPEEIIRKAEVAFNKAVEAKQDFVPAHFNLAMIWARQNKVTEAIARLELVKQVATNDTNLAFQLGLLYYQTGELESAKRELARAVVLDNNFSNARYFLGLILDREGDSVGAIEQFEKIAALNPENQIVIQILGNLRAGLPALGLENSGDQVIAPVNVEVVPSTDF
jgi:tetratricopeptide (TPR) repeat protein